MEYIANNFQGITIIVSVSYVVGSVCLWIWHVEIPQLVHQQTGKNDDASAKEQFLAMLARATHTLIVHDDGDNMDVSVYNDQEVLDAVENRLATTKRLTIKILFNFREPLEIYALAANHDRLEISTLDLTHEQRPEHDVHYKIADGGKYAYLSLHGRGSPERRFESYECPRAFSFQRKALFGTYEQHFKASDSPIRLAA